MLQTRIEPLPWQKRVLSIAETTPEGLPLNLFLGGSKGGGKSFLLRLLICRWTRDYPGGTAIVTRSRLKSLMTFQFELGQMLQAMYGKAAVRWNQQTSSFTLDNGCQILMGALDSPQQLGQLAGVSAGLLVCDEAGFGPDPELLVELMLNVREAPGRTVVAANPGQRQHSYWAQLIALAPGFEIRNCNGQLWVNCPSHWEQNEHLNHVQMESQFDQMRAMDASKAAALADGDWSAIAGDFFGTCWTNDLIYDHNELPFDIWRSPLKLGVDVGSLSPTAFVLAGWTRWDHELRDGRVIPANSWLVHDLHYECDGDNLGKGSGRSPSEIAPYVKAMCNRNGCAPAGWVDPAAVARPSGRLESSILDLYRLNGINLRPAPRTRRVPGWDLMRALMRDRRFWVADRNQAWLRTVPFLPRSEHDPEDLDTTSNDHIADATRMGLVSMSGGQIGSWSWR